MVKISTENSEKQNCDKIAGGRVALTILKCVALWPWRYEYTSRNQKLLYSKIQLIHRWILHVPLSLTFCLLMWVEVFISTDLNEAANVVFMSLALAMYLMKFINIRVFSKKAVWFIYEMEHNKMFDLLKPEEVEMWMKHHKSFRMVSIIYIFGSAFSSFFAFVGVLFEEDYHLGYPYYVPFEWRNPERYWYAFVFNWIGILVSCFSNVSLDMLGCYMIFHVGLLYKLLGMRLYNLRSLKEAVAITEFRKLFLMHSCIKRMTKECEILISHYVLTQIIFSGLIVCFSGYRMQKMNILAEFSQFFSMLQFLSVMIMEMYLPCHYANQITANSAELINNIYDCEWLQFSVVNRKFICLYMEFFKEPEQLKAGKYFELGLPIFTKVTQVTIVKIVKHKTLITRTTNNGH